jgi:hypothetical protein
LTASLEQLQAGQLLGTRQLKLACGLTEFPREIFDLAETLEVLDLSGNALSALPDDLPRLTKLRIVFASNNQFTELPHVLGECERLTMVGFKANRIREVSAKALPRGLRWLILTDNEVEALPAELGQCALLQKLMLAGNRLSTLPKEMAQCTRLELVRLSANRLTALPEWLTGLPRLSWLAYAGNPFGASLEAAASAETSIPDIHWASLVLDEKLGEGASGVIYHATRIDDEGRAAQPVAVKLFKGAVTSDGLPDCEMAACIHAGRHSNLIPVLGRVQGHPTGQHGLVMELIDPAFVNLAGPPTLDSCTRDFYAADVRFDLAEALGIAYGIASAASHLHERGIMHGDLYAHNILHRGHERRAFLGDFGAASLYDIGDRKLGLALQRLEVRAFGCLLEELVERCTERTSQVAHRLQALAAACLSEAMANRPTFETLSAELRGLAGGATPRSYQ